METLALTVANRTEVGKGATGRLRRNGFIPGVVYTGGHEAVMFQVDSHHYALTFSGKSMTQLLQFKSDDKELSGKLVLVKDVQIEPLKGKVLHLDFFEVKKGQKITVTVPVKIVGESPAVKEGVAFLNQSAYELELECLPKEIPQSVVVDVSGLELGQSIHASQIELPENTILKSDPEMSVIGASLKKIEQEPEPEVAEELAEGDEGAPEAGEQTPKAEDEASGTADKDKKSETKKGS